MNLDVWKIDFVIVGATVLLLIVLVGYAQPLVIAPLNEHESTDGDVLFEFEGAEILLIDDNEGFTSPDEYNVLGGQVVSLEPGVYYWKVSGILKSEVRKLTIRSRVDLKLVETVDGFGVVNAGNVRLNVDIYDDDSLVGKKKLDVGEGVDGGDKYVGGYDE